MRNMILGLAFLAASALFAETASADHGCYYGGGYGGSYGYGGGYGYSGAGYGYPSGVYAARANYGYGYYRPYNTYYAPNVVYTNLGTRPVAVYPPGYLPPRYYGGVGYFGGVGSGYYYGAGPRVRVGY